MLKQFKGKAIYNPSGKAAEYSAWACNFYVGCSNGCEYCYCKKGILAKVMGQDKPQLKKCFDNEEQAYFKFKDEMIINEADLKNSGIFFSFTTDPMLPETIDLTIRVMYLCANWSIPVKILTKVATISMVNRLIDDSVHGIFDDTEEDMIISRKAYRSKIAIGFTLTGHDELEPGASTNMERIEAMKKLHDAGFKTFASIEPIIDFESAKAMIMQTIGFCDLYKIGLMSGKKYDQVDAQSFVEWLSDLPAMPKIYLKESLQKLTHYTNEELDVNFITSDYNLFKS